MTQEQYGYSDAIDCYDTFGNFNTRHKPNAKARSIVAMLFWEWKKDKRMVKSANKYTIATAEMYCNCSHHAFDKAYKMLKEQQ